MTTDFAYEGGLPWWIVLLFVSVTIPGAVFMIYHKIAPGALWISLVLIVAFVCWNVYITINNRADAIRVIAQTTGVTNLIVNEPPPRCTRDFNGFMSAATWTDGDDQKVGLLMGLPHEGMCRYILKPVNNS